MRKLIAVALLAVAIGAIFHFWPYEQSPAPESRPQSATSRESPAAPASGPAPARQPATASAPSSERSAPGTAVERATPASPVQISIHAPQTVRLGETFAVTIEIHAVQGVRQLVFSVVYKKSILELAETSPGAFARQGGPSAQFEEVSDGSVIVRVGTEGSVIAGAGSVAVVEFRALRSGVSPLAINGVSYLAEGRQTETNNPVAYEGTITVE